MTTRTWQAGDHFVFLFEAHDDWIDTIYGQVLCDLGGGRYRVIAFHESSADKGVIEEYGLECLTLPISETQMTRARRLGWPQAAF